MSDHLDDRLRTTYATAMGARHGLGSVSIHVGWDVWQCLRMPYVRSLSDEDRNLWGFPILLEMAWPNDKIAVVITEVIG